MRRAQPHVTQVLGDVWQELLLLSVLREQPVRGIRDGEAVPAAALRPRARSVGR